MKNAGSDKYRTRVSVFVCTFSLIFERVFGRQKICLRYFKIGQTYFKICALYFFLAPMWGKRTENQFSLFRPGNARFPAPFLRRTMSVLLQVCGAAYLARSNRREARGILPGREKQEFSADLTIVNGRGG